MSSADIYDPNYHYFFPGWESDTYADTDTDTDAGSEELYADEVYAEEPAPAALDADRRKSCCSFIDIISTWLKAHNCTAEGDDPLSDAEARCILDAISKTNGQTAICIQKEGCMETMLAQCEIFMSVSNRVLYGLVSTHGVDRHIRPFTISSVWDAPVAQEIIKIASENAKAKHRALRGQNMELRAYQDRNGLVFPESKPSLECLLGFLSCLSMPKYCVYDCTMNDRRALRAFLRLMYASCSRSSDADAWSSMGIGGQAAGGRRKATAASASAPESASLDPASFVKCPGHLMSSKTAKKRWSELAPDGEIPALDISRASEVLRLRPDVSKTK